MFCFRYVEKLERLKKLKKEKEQLQQRYVDDVMMMSCDVSGGYKWLFCGCKQSSDQQSF